MILSSGALPAVAGGTTFDRMADGTFDALGLARRLRDRAGFNAEHAEEAAQAIAEAFAPQIATRSDLAVLRADLGSDIAVLRADLGVLRAEVKTDLADLRSDLTRLILTVATGQVALLLAAMFSLARLGG